MEGFLVVIGFFGVLVLILITTAIVSVIIWFIKFCREVIDETIKGCVSFFNETLVPLYKGFLLIIKKSYYYLSLPIVFLFLVVSSPFNFIFTKIFNCDLCTDQMASYLLYMKLSSDEYYFKIAERLRRRNVEQAVAFYYKVSNYGSLGPFKIYVLNKILGRSVSSELSVGIWGKYKGNIVLGYEVEKVYIWNLSLMTNNGKEIISLCNTREELDTQEKVCFAKSLFEVNRFEDFIKYCDSNEAEMIGDMDLLRRYRVFSYFYLDDLVSFLKFSKQDNIVDLEMSLILHIKRREDLVFCFKQIKNCCSFMSSISDVELIYSYDEKKVPYLDRFSSSSAPGIIPLKYMVLSLQSSLQSHELSLINDQNVKMLIFDNIDFDEFDDAMDDIRSKSLNGARCFFIDSRFLESKYHDDEYSQEEMSYFSKQKNDLDSFLFDHLNNVFSGFLTKKYKLKLLAC